MTISTTAINVENYDWVINYKFIEDEVVEFEGKNGKYEIYWDQMRNGGISKLTLTINDKPIYK